MEPGCRTIQEFRVSRIHEFNNLYSLIGSLNAFPVIYRPIYGLIFLFKYVQDDEPAGSVVQDSRLEQIFFAKQVFSINLFNRHELSV